MILLQASTASLAKNPPRGYWDGVVARFRLRGAGDPLPVGDGGLTAMQAADLMDAGRVQACVGVDSWLLHLAANRGVPAVGIFAPSDPKLFGRKGNENLCKRTHLRPDQLGVWVGQKAPPAEAWPDPDDAAEAVLLYCFAPRTVVLNPDWPGHERARLLVTTRGLI